LDVVESLRLGLALAETARQQRIREGFKRTPTMPNEWETGAVLAPP
jgi:hypothetical protein